MQEQTSFEDAVERLEQIVTAMESGRLSLDECLVRFEQAVALSRFCSARLEAAEKQVSVLTAESGLQGEAALPWELNGAGEGAGELF